MLEVCVDNLDGIIAAKNGGAGRIEFCSALEVGGLTPSFGAVVSALEFGIEVFVMIRPRSGDFCYSLKEVESMLSDIKAYKKLGVQGFVFGALDKNGRLDKKINEDLISACGNLPATLHRAFDVSESLEESLETAIEIGFSRVLTSGGKPTALEGIEIISNLIEKAEDKIIILPGSGFTSKNVRSFLEQVSVKEIHASCKTKIASEDNLNIGRKKSSEIFVTDESEVRKMVSAIQNL